MLDTFLSCTQYFEETFLGVIYSLSKLSVVIAIFENMFATIKIFMEMWWMGKETTTLKLGLLKLQDTVE